MSKEKELLKMILANTNAIMEYLKIKGVEASEKLSDKSSKKPQSKSVGVKKDSAAKSKSAS